MTLIPSIALLLFPLLAACGALEPSDRGFDAPGAAMMMPGSVSGPTPTTTTTTAGAGAGPNQNNPNPQPGTGGSTTQTDAGSSSLPVPEPGTGGTGGTGSAGTGGTSSTPVPGATGSDDIFGQSVPRADAFWVEGGRIHRGGEEITLRGLNWFGLDTDALALHGPAQARRSIPDFLSQLKTLGFNALRVPLAPESIKPGVPSAAWANDGAADTGREHFEALATAAKNAGVLMLWDVHTCAASVGHLKNGPADPACGGYDESDWLADLRTLATLAKQYAPFVVGIDLFNEPYGLTYERWRELAGQGGRAVLELNPRILVFMEGVGSQGYQGSQYPFWGENLTGVASAPVDLPASRLVYSPHAYGPSVSDQAYFNTPAFPRNMPAIWDEHFGYLWDAGHAVVPGEFGGVYTGADKIWQDAFVDYLKSKGAHSFFYWCLNPNSGDTGGLLLDDWRSVNMDKLTLLSRLNP